MQHGGFNDDKKFDQEMYNILLLTTLMSKLGCDHLLNTYGCVHGRLSNGQCLRNMTL